MTLDLKNKTNVFVSHLLQEVLEETEVAAILISAVVHDLDHPGYTNPFLCNSKNDLSMLYNDK